MLGYVQASFFYWRCVSYFPMLFRGISPHFVENDITIPQLKNLFSGNYKHLSYNRLTKALTIPQPTARLLLFSYQDIC